MKHLIMILICGIMVACSQIADPNRLKDGDLVTFVQIPEREGQIMFCADYFSRGRVCRVRYIENGVIKDDGFKPFELRRK